VLWVGDVGGIVILGLIVSGFVGHRNSF